MKTMTEAQATPAVDFPPPIARKQNWLDAAFVQVSATMPSATEQMERRGNYSAIHARVSCRTCDGQGKLGVESESKWSEQRAAYAALGLEEVYERNIDRPKVRTCPTCGGQRDVSAKGRRIIPTARPTGSSVPLGGANTADEYMPLVIAKAARVARRVEARSRLHGYALRAYYGTVEGLGRLGWIWHRKLSALYPLTPTGDRLIAQHDDGDRDLNPWNLLDVLSRSDNEEIRTEFRFIVIEAYTLLCDAVRMFDEESDKEADGVAA